MSAQEPARTDLRLSDQQRIDWLRLIRSENVGPATFRMLINRFGSAADALNAIPDLAQRGGAARRIKVTDRSEAEAELSHLRQFGGKLIALGEADYPSALAHIDGPPPLLSVKGDTALFEKHAIAIVGSRNASAVGMKMAETLARDLGQADFIIVSGLARGIDATAHRSALTQGTAAVFAGGLNIIYPPENTTLVDEILAHKGVILTEMPFGFKPRAREFPRRNRLIAGMSLATLVIEAAQRSGSLITARLALEQGREVLAVPGSPLDPRAAGTNGLIKQGAQMVTEVGDVLDALSAYQDIKPGAFLSAGAEDPLNDLAGKDPDESERGILVGALGPAPIGIDDLIHLTGLPTATVLIILLELELAGRLDRQSGQRVSLRPAG